MSSIESLIPYGYELFDVRQVNHGENYIGKDGVYIWAQSEPSDFVTVVIKKKAPERITFVECNDFGYNLDARYVKLSDGCMIRDYYDIPPELSGAKHPLE